MKSLSNFSNEALNRAEMKSVSGGCGVKCSGSWMTGLSKSSAKSWLGHPECTNWCCKQCPK
jgi:natural product precursor